MANSARNKGSEITAITNALDELRGFRDKHKIGSKLRSSYNEACDRLAVLQSRAHAHYQEQEDDAIDTAHICYFCGQDGCDCDML